jgi:hypothetical protein
MQGITSEWLRHVGDVGDVYPRARASTRCRGGCEISPGDATCCAKMA